MDTITMQNNLEKTVWTPLKIIQWGVPYLKQRGIQNPKLDAEILIAHALKIDRLKVYLQFDRPLTQDELTSIRDLLKRRALQEPIQYITGQKEFFGLPFKVAPGVLIPRPETEYLVENAVNYLKEIPLEKRLVLDLGTGSGCIGISIAKNVSCRVWAIDLFEKALEIAKENAERLEIGSSIIWRKGNWFDSLQLDDPAQFSVIVSNPPYIPLKEKKNLSPEIVEYEPPEALFAGEDGLKAYMEISQGLKHRILPLGAVFLELNANCYDKIVKIFRHLGWNESVYRDLQGLPRILKLKKEE
jgi:release factor glutamine methyltransferase